MAQASDLQERAVRALEGLRQHTTRGEVSGALVEALEALEQAAARGERVRIAAESVEVSTEEAARLLGCSRAHLLRLLARGTGPSYRMVGTHRRFQRDEVLRFGIAQRNAQLEGMRALQAEAEELDLGY